MQTPQVKLPHAAGDDPIQRSALKSSMQAQRHRAHAGVLASAMRNDCEQHQYWLGYATALNEIASSLTGRMAATDAAAGGYVPTGCLKTIWDERPTDIEQLSIAQVQDYLAAQGVTPA